MSVLLAASHSRMLLCFSLGTSSTADWLSQYQFICSSGYFSMAYVIPAAIPANSIRVESMSPLAEFALMSSHPHPRSSTNFVAPFVAMIIHPYAPLCPSFFSPDPSDPPIIWYPCVLYTSHACVAMGITDFLVSGMLLIRHAVFVRRLVRGASAHCSTGCSRVARPWIALISLSDSTTMHSCACAFICLYFPLSHVMRPIISSSSPFQGPVLLHPVTVCIAGIVVGIVTWSMTCASLAFASYMLLVLVMSLASGAASILHTLIHDRMFLHLSLTLLLYFFSSTSSWIVIMSCCLSITFPICVCPSATIDTIEPFSIGLWSIIMLPLLPFGILFFEAFRAIMIALHPGGSLLLISWFSHHLGSRVIPSLHTISLTMCTLHLHLAVRTSSPIAVSAASWMLRSFSRTRSLFRTPSPFSVSSLLGFIIHCHNPMLHRCL